MTGKHDRDIACFCDSCIDSWNDFIRTEGIKRELERWEHDLNQECDCLACSAFHNIKSRYA